jgi:hypothetical protein
MKCTNNQRQIGLGIHNFHDARNAAPPLALASAIGYGEGLTFLGAIYPFIEQQALYEKIVTRSGKDVHDNTATGLDVAFGLITSGNYDWWGTLTKQEQAGFSIPIYQCPSRRSGASSSHIDPSDINANYLTPGPVGDYVATLVADNETDLGGMTAFFYITYGLGSEYFISARLDLYLSPRTVSAIHSLISFPSIPYSTSPNANSWEPLHNFTFVSDGLSNYLMVGEKFVPTAKLGKCSTNDGLWDCSYLSTSGGASMIGVAGRDIYNPSISNIIARGDNDYDNTISYLLQTGQIPNFGGSHVGIANFLLGDGSVHGISATISRDLLHYLGNANDGNVASLP